MSFEQGETKRLGWIEQVEKICEILERSASICSSIIGATVLDGKESPRKEPSNTAEALDDALRNLQSRAGTVLSQLEDIVGKF